MKKKFPWLCQTRPKELVISTKLSPVNKKDCVQTCPKPKEAKAFFGWPCLSPLERFLLQEKWRQIYFTIEVGWPLFVFANF